MVTIGELRALTSRAISNDQYYVQINGRPIVHVHIQGSTLWLNTGPGFPVPARIFQLLLSGWAADNLVSVLEA